MKKSVKILIIILSVILALVLIFAIGYGIFCFQVGQLKFDHCDNLMGNPPEYSVTTPFFANSLMAHDGHYELFILEPGAKNIPIYDAINSYMYDWLHYVHIRYQQAKTDYSLEQNDKIITVNLSGNAVDWEGNDTVVEDKLVFNIENASTDNLPKWVSDESSYEFKEFITYCQNKDTMSPPKWYPTQSQVDRAFGSIE